jgi:hypothetical protein
MELSFTDLRAPLSEVPFEKVQLSKSYTIKFLSEDVRFVLPLFDPAEKTVKWSDSGERSKMPGMGGSASS